MPGFDHRPAPQQRVDPPAQAHAHAHAKNARYGAILFLAYLLLYGGFVAINALEPGVMGTVVVAGVNVAVIYGFGLVVAAFVFALVYFRLCRHPAPVRSTSRRQ
jgi:uncharacterized membrane protein (DUF485 family)